MQMGVESVLLYYKVSYVGGIVGASNVVLHCFTHSIPVLDRTVPWMPFVKPFFVCMIP